MKNANFDHIFDSKIIFQKQVIILENITPSCLQWKQNTETTLSVKMLLKNESKIKKLEMKKKKKLIKNKSY